MDAMPQKNKKQDVVLNTDTAKQMLSNIFEACEYEHNRVPLEVLESYSNYRRERHGLQKVIIILVFIAFLLLPLLFVTPEVTPSWDPKAELGRPVLSVAVDTFIPVESVKAFMEDRELDVYLEADGSYQIRPVKNGILKVIVTLVNKQFTQTMIEVKTADTTAPTLLKHELLKGGYLKLTLWDESGELDYASIYAIKMTGEKLLPSNWDEEEMSVLFAYPRGDLNIFVPDKYGNALQLILNIEGPYTEAP